jgi:hypothetical protein
MLIGARGASKTFLLSLYAMLRATFTPGCKIVVVGAAFRQSKLLFEYMETFWRQSPIYRSIVGSGKGQGPKRDIDRCNFYIGDSEITAIPIGDGSKIRGLRGNYILADEFHSIPQEIFEVVIRGFGSVSARPDKQAKGKAAVKIMKEMGFWTEAKEQEENLGFGNQTVISGTAYYSFDHFYSYWTRYKKIIESTGSQRKLSEIFLGRIPDGFDPHHYSVMRIPVSSIPDGFMDKAQIAQAQATMHTSLYNMEYEAVFADDSDGFFKRSLIETCVTKRKILTEDGEVQFQARLHGDQRPIYVYGIDPASESDNFAIVILEIHPNHRRIVYSWTITRDKLRKRVVSGKEDADKSFYNYCAAKIRELMTLFPTEHIGMDAQGGGIAVMEALHDGKLINKEEEHLIWPYIKQGEDDPLWWEDEEKPTDGQPGFHILHMTQNANAEFVYESNHGLRKDFESKIVLFPFFDSISIEQSIEEDKVNNRIYDTLEDCVMEIEDLKDELAYIEHSQTPSGRDKWDTPEAPTGTGNKKKRLRKDRYSALAIANQIARCLTLGLTKPQYKPVGGYVGQHRDIDKKSGALYVGPAHLTKKMITGAVVRRKR